MPYLTGRESFREVVLRDRLCAVLKRINLDDDGQPRMVSAWQSAAGSPNPAVYRANPSIAASTAKNSYNPAMQELSLIQFLAVAILPLLFAITVHEVAHGWVALRLGDPTAQMMGRLTLNPIRHIDPFGTVLLPIMLIVLSKVAGTPPFVFGWAKPVPVTWENLRNPKRDMALVALAGPMSNLLMAILWAVVTKIGYLLGAGALGLPLILMGTFGILFNLVLMVLNLFPLPPLDGGRILTSVLPGPMAWQVGRIEPYGFLIILLLLATGVLWSIMGPVIDWFYTLLHTLFGI